MAIGRPSKLTPELTDRIVERVLKGIEPDTAAQAEGIDRATYYRWIKAGREDETGETVHATFASRIACACAEAESGLVETWLGGDEQGVGFGPAKAAAEFLRLT
jgi:transposase-like protein